MYGMSVKHVVREHMNVPYADTQYMNLPYSMFITIYMSVAYHYIQYRSVNLQHMDVP